MSKKRIVHIIPRFDLGGVQTGILYSLAELNKYYDFRVLVIDSSDREWLKTLPTQIQGCISFSGVSGLGKREVAAYKVLRILKPDLVISSLWKSVFVSATYKLFNPKSFLLGFYHNAFPSHFAENLLLKLLSVKQDAALADSLETKGYIEKTYHNSNIHVVPYNFEFARNNFTRSKLNPSLVRMAYFGRLTHAKGVDRDIAFCRLLKNAGIKFVFDLYGAGDFNVKAQEEYRGMIKQLDLENEVRLQEVIPPGFVLEKMYAYDFLLQLSNREGMALSVVEAMNCGLVPVVTPVGEIQRYSADGVNSIWLHHEFDHNLPALVDGLVKAINDPAFYDQLSSNASGTFIHYKKYSEAMREAIDDLLH